MGNLDYWVHNYFTLHRTSPLTEVMYIFTGFFDPSLPTFILIIFTALLIYLLRDFKAFCLFLFTLVAGWGLVYIFKYLFDINRPLDGVILAFGQSFPSGHTTAATIFFVMIWYLIRPIVRGLGVNILTILSIIGVVGVAFSRVYLGVHWLSDVLAGVVLGLVTCYVALKFFKKLTL